MNRLLQFLFFVFSVTGFSQSIVVSGNSFTNDQLVNTVLLNSACVGATNITSRTGTNIGINGIGSFTNTNPNFPMTKGVILSTGNVLSAVGPNNSALDEGSTAWTGDNDLAIALGNLSTDYLNASVLEFDFTPVSPNFSFDFIFASEEYGSLQCANFPDAFAFLLKNTVTGTTTNLAVLPNTSIPISVEKVRNTAFNGFCESVNPNFFGNFYGGNNSSFSPTNFNGETVLLNASAVLTPGVLYHIKLVIADRKDFKYDSAVFISGTSFNIGQDVLGPDLTVANKKAICFGTNYTIPSGLDPLLYDFVWTKVGSPTVILGTAASLIVNTAGNYQLSYKKKVGPCAPEINTIIIEFYPEIQTIAPINIIKCIKPATTTYEFDIALNTPILLNSLSNAEKLVTQIAYFSDNLATNPITSPFTSLPNRNVYVKITNTLTGCSIIKQFQLLTITETLAFTKPPVVICEDSSGTSTANLTFSNYDATILGIQAPSAFSVTYYLNQPDANNGALNLQISKDSYSVLNGSTIFARVENKTDPTCFKTTSFLVTVNPKPTITDFLLPVFVCTKYVLPSLSTPGAQYWTGPNGTGTQIAVGTEITTPLFSNPTLLNVYLPNANCPDQKPLTITFVDINLLPKPTPDNCDKFVIPNLIFAKFFTESHLNGGNGGVELVAGTELTLSQTIFLYFKSIDEPNCEQELSFEVKITPSPVLPSFANIFKCVGEFYTLPPLVPIPNATVNYYNSNTFIPANIIADGTKITSTQTIFVRATSGTVPCVDIEQFTVFVGLPNPTSTSSCESFALPELPVGQYYAKAGGPGITGSPTAQTPIPFGTIITTSQSVYIYVKSDPKDLPSSNCFFDEKLTITITLPIFPSGILQNITICEKYKLPALPLILANTSINPIQNYRQLSYNTAADGSGTVLNANQEITTSQTIYVLASDGLSLPICSKSLPIVININSLPTIPLQPKYQICEPSSFTRPVGIDFYYGPNKTGGLIPDGTIFSVDTKIYAYTESTSNPPCSKESIINIEIYITKAIQYPNINQCTSYILPAIVQPNPDDNNAYYSAPGRDPLNLINAGTEIFSTQTIYVNNRKDIRFFCEDETSFTVTINPNPDVPLQTPVFACDSYQLPPLTVGNYFTETHYPLGTVTGGTLIPVGTLIDSSKTIYIFAGNSNLVGCNSDEEALSITINKVSKLPNVTQCGSYKLPTVTSGTISTTIVGDYYTASGGTGVLLQKGTDITPTFPAVTGIQNNKTIRRIYLYKAFQSTLNPPTCASETFFDVTIITTPEVKDISILDRTFCDTDQENNGKKFIDLAATYNATVLGSQITPEYSVAYYNLQSDADLEKDKITTSIDINNSQEIFVRINNSLAPLCWAIKPFKFFINKLPESTAKDGAICKDSATGLILNPYVIQTGLSNISYEFVWKNEAGSTIGSDNFLSVAVPGIYSLNIKDKSTTCNSVNKLIKVVFSQKAIVSYSLSENFSDNQFVTIIAVGSGGDYEYQLDDLNYQNSNIFTQVPFGKHVVNVRDKNGCGISSVDILVVNYPKYFTPNGDGFNETWNVIGLEQQLQSKIFIFDRFGKLLKQISPNEAGWDGKFNEEMQPSTDYWFVVSYLEDGIEKTFKSHFSLKR